MPGKQHVWIRHTMAEIDVKPLGTRFNTTVKLDGKSVHVEGCDDCGLPLTMETFLEPCLSDLQDELEEAMERGD